MFESDVLEPFMNSVLERVEKFEGSSEIKKRVW